MHLQYPLNHRVIFGPEKMIMVPPRHYCIIENPAQRGEGGEIVLDKSGQIKLNHADQEIRLAQEPFPLYPGEVLKQVGRPKMIKCIHGMRIVPWQPGDQTRTKIKLKDMRIKTQYKDIV